MVKACNIKKYGPVFEHGPVKAAWSYMSLFFSWLAAVLRLSALLHLSVFRR